MIARRIGIGLGLGLGIVLGIGLGLLRGGDGPQMEIGLAQAAKLQARTSPRLRPPPRRRPAGAPRAVSKLAGTAPAGKPGKALAPGSVKAALPAPARPAKSKRANPPKPRLLPLARAPGQEGICVSYCQGYCDNVQVRCRKSGSGARECLARGYRSCMNGCTWQICKMPPGKRPAYTGNRHPDLETQ